MATSATLTGPVTGGGRGWPFSLPLTDLASVGYVAEEFFIAGAAAAYEAEPGAELPVDGKWRVRPSRTAPFRTRVLVVRPVEGARFNGVVHVNWQNVTAGFELGTADLESGQLLGGFAWVGVSAQRVGVHGLPGTEQFALRGWDPERYGTLNHPGDDFSFDIYTQAARAIGPAILGGAEARKLVASGASQSALRLRTYANAIQPMERLFDGFLFLVDFGRGALPDTGDADAATLPKRTVPVQIRDDLGVPALVFNSETEAPALFPVRQPDTDMLRLWEVAGACHMSGGASREALAPLFARDGIGFRGGGSTGAAVVLENPNLLSYTPAYRAAFRHFHIWLEGGPPPPPQARIEFESADPPTIRRDQYGNALGGVRLPDIAVPTGEHRGRNDDMLQWLFGYSRPFTAAELHQLYPSREAYLGQWHAALDRGVADGFILSEDAPAMKAIADETANTIFPR
ncbi:MAG TPA: alpha/beta hydrolase domain-containing protein [Propionibacteriaceae bacterium]